MALEAKMGLPTREAYGKTLVELGKENPRIVVLDADLSKSTKTEYFSKAFPDRFINCGIQEANMVGIAAGLASSGKIPFLSSFACFLVCKGYDQLRMSVAYPSLDVKVVSSHGGISVGEDGASQQSIEDIALMNTLPGFAVMVPSDQYAAAALVRLAVKKSGPVYIRTGRPKAAIIHSERTKFEIGKGIVVREGKDVAIIANGLSVWESLLAAETLAKEGIEATVADMHTVKPIDRELVRSLAVKTGAIVTTEEHQIWGGLGSTVARTLAETVPVPQELVGIKDTYAESGKPDELFDKYELSARFIVAAAKRVLERKKSLSGKMQPSAAR